MSKKLEPYVYKATLERVDDGDTIDVTLDLGFDVKLHKQRCRLAGIDTPESRTRNLKEKVLGKMASARLSELCVGTFKILNTEIRKRTSPYIVFNVGNKCIIPVSA